jgi:hypothetical protein
VFEGSAQNGGDVTKTCVDAVLKRRPLTQASLRYLIMLAIQLFLMVKSWLERPSYTQSQAQVEKISALTGVTVSILHAIFVSRLAA